MALPNLPFKTGHIFIGLAVLMGVMTMFLFGNPGKQPKTAKVQAKIQTQNVVVPLAPISEGKMLSMNDVTTVKWPSEFIPKGTLFEDPYQVVGRVAKQDLFPGEPIFTAKLSGSNTNGGMTAIIPKGMRAVTVAVTEVKGVAGFVKPGDRVDVLSTFEVASPDGQSSDKSRTTRTVLQNVLVLASAQTMVDEGKYEMETPDGVMRGEATPKVVSTEEKAGKDKEKEKDQKKKDADREKEAKQREKEKKEAQKAARLVSSVTLALLPEQTETLALAEETGDIRLALRPETDHAISELKGVSFDALIGNTTAKKMAVTGRMPAPPQLPAQPAAPMMHPGSQVEFIQGTDKTTFSF